MRGAEGAWIDPELARIAGEDPVMVFDGVCNLCSAWVRFALARDAAGRLYFVAAQSPLGQDFLKRRGLPTDVFESFYFVENGLVLQKSVGFFAMIKYLRQPWPLLRIFRFLPRPISDRLYDRIARNRYRWFGKRDTCLMPDPAIGSRFLA
jgi:predicted DCC family thiol-disulfide oxidoreductase YuxK